MRLVNSILDFSRIESGRAQASYEPSDLATMTTYLASAFRSAVERHGLTFEVDCQSLPESVYVDHDMWEKIVLNLLSNALKFTFEGSVGVSVRWRGDHAELEVRDTGTGIPEKELPRLFERFHRVHGARSRTHEGSGIGLALVHEMVRLHGGNVQVASKPGEGTTFTVSIPCGSAHLPPERIVAKRSTAWTAKGAKPFVEEALRWSAGSRPDAVGLPAAAPTPGIATAAVPILVVDDNADLRDYIVNLLGQHYVVETAVDGLAALEAARLRKPALVLSDVMMPRLDGFGLLRALRADPVLRDVPVILLSARAGEESTIEGLEAGADDYLVKPFAARELLARVRTHVEFSLMRQRLLLLEAAPDPLVIVDPVGCISVVNGQTERVFGYSRADLIGKPVDMLIPNRFRDRFLGYRMEFAARHQIRPMASVLDLYGQRSDGSEFPIEISLSPFDTHEGLVVSTTIRDVTERKRLEQVNRQAFELETQNRRIREASRLKSEFLANMSHELRTPLNSILGFGELLYDGGVPYDSPQHREFLGDIIKSGRHLLQLIDDVLDLAKVEAGKLEFRPEAIDLEMVIAEVLSIVRAISVAKNVRIDASIDPVLKQGILLDPARLKQVLYNFISNALKFTLAGGVVTVRARPHGEESLLLEVEDTGSGIAPEDLERLFVEFQQLEAGTAKQHGGTGLGLALTRRLAEAQGGSVGVRSTLGKGSVFHVVLPRRRPVAAAQPQFQPRPAAPDAPSVLVIEDDARDQAQLVEALGAAGYAVEAASTGSQALALCSVRKFDAICLDLLLPDMSGQEVLQRVRGGGPNRDVPVVVVTIVAERGAVAGFTVQGFLPKPIDSDALLSSLARAGVRPNQQGSVLVVDDDEASLRLMAAALTQLGFRTVRMQSGEEALRAAANAAPAAIVLDLLMPGVDGFEFLDRLRDSPATRHTPVLIWSVKDLSTHEQARLSRSVQAIVRKGRGGIPALLDDLRRFLPAGPRALTGD
jgi:PAS domain S-box-containing protein